MAESLCRYFIPSDKTKYEQNPSQNQDILNLSAYTNINIKLHKAFYFDMRFNYNRFENESFGFN